MVWVGAMSMDTLNAVVHQLPTTLNATFSIKPREANVSEALETRIELSVYSIGRVFSIAASQRQGRTKQLPT